jgi:hypothetical protein
MSRLEGLPRCLYSPSCREQTFSETHIQPRESLCVWTGRDSISCPDKLHAVSLFVTRLYRYSGSLGYRKDGVGCLFVRVRAHPHPRRLNPDLSPKTSPRITSASPGSFEIGTKRSRRLLTSFSTSSLNNSVAFPAGRGSLASPKPRVCGLAC